MDRKFLQGVGIDTLTFEQALDAASCGQVVTVNPEMISEAARNPHFAQILREAQLVIPDGIGVELGLRILGHKVKRIAGIEFARELLNRCESAALVGGAPQVAQTAAKNLDGANIIYVHDGYFTDAAPIIEELKTLKPALLLVAMGSPKQEEFIYNLKPILPNTLMVGVGGSFDVWAGNVKRAPAWVQKLCLEWLWRTIKEPKRFKRIFPALPLFLLKCIIERK